jgi:hypothetical protein
MGERRRLHSRYDPRAEAEKYVSSLALPPEIKYFILIDPGLCYLAPALRKASPGCAVIALDACESPQDGGEDPFPEENKPDAFYSYPGDGPVEKFLEGVIPDGEARLIRIVEWRAALPLHREKYLALLEGAARFLKRSDANARTTKAFGKIWIRNFFKNTGIIKRAVVPFRGVRPVVIAGAGPSLEETLPLLKPSLSSGGALLLASSSAFLAVKNSGLKADAVIATDGGSWALLHLRELFRCGSEAPLLAAAMTAALPSQASALPFIVICDGSLWQKIILSGLGIPFVTLPQRGTVTAQALDLAAALTDGNIIISGVDLASRGIKTHAKPYAFDVLRDEKASRLSPAYSLQFARQSLMKEGGSYDVYAGWFAHETGAYKGKVFSVGANNGVFSALQVTAEKAQALLSGGGKKAESGRAYVEINIPCPEKTAFALLRNAFAQGAIAGTLTEELRPLLGVSGGAEEVIEALNEAV